MKLRIFDYSLSNVLNDSLIKHILIKQNYNMHFINYIIILKQ